MGVAVTVMQGSSTGPREKLHMFLRLHSLLQTRVQTGRVDVVGHSVIKESSNSFILSQHTYTCISVWMANASPSQLTFAVIVSTTFRSLH